MNDPMKHFPDPDDVGQMEYRTIYETLRDTLRDCPEEERFDLAVSMLDEFEWWAKDIKSRLASSEKPS